MAPNSLNFVWWNAQSLAHFDETRAGEFRWPTSKEACDEKCRRVDAVLRRIMNLRGDLHLIGLAEVTNVAAHQLRDRVFPGYSVCSLDLFGNDSDFHVAILYRPDCGMSEKDPLVAPSVPRSTRPMAVVDFVKKSHTVKFIACHWNARFGESTGDEVRTRLAYYVSGQIYDFLHDAPNGTRHDVIVIGDLNTEPFGILESWHDAFRNRQRSGQREHYTDRDVKRIRLYNCAWRWLGEHWPHSPWGWQCPSIAGTYFREPAKCWYTYDQILVTGGLLTQELPTLAESDVCRFVDETVLDPDGVLRQFNWNGGDPFGVSDHLPIIGKVLY